MVQILVLIVALALQLYATYLVLPLRKLVQANLWRLLMVLNLFVIFRRMLTAIEVGIGWSGQWYESLAAIVGLGVSVFMLKVVINLRKFIEIEQKRTVELASAMLNAGKCYHAENSLAYQLAEHFIRQHEANAKSSDSDVEHPLI